MAARLNLHRYRSRGATASRTILVAIETLRDCVRRAARKGGDFTGNYQWEIARNEVFSSKNRYVSQTPPQSS
jgi:hypothetical protein